MDFSFPGQNVTNNRHIYLCVCVVFVRAHTYICMCKLDSKRKLAGEENINVDNGSQSLSSIFYTHMDICLDSLMGGVSTSKICNKEKPTLFGGVEPVQN